MDRGKNDLLGGDAFLERLESRQDRRVRRAARVRFGQRLLQQT